MEEEVITPEEETFEYNKLRYILDKNGYVCHASIGGLIVCDLGECTEYIGEVPNGYSSIEEWYDKEIEKINAWKIIDGNLVYDENKYKELQKQYEIEAEENQCSTHRWVKDRLKISNSVVTDELSLETSGNSLLILNDAGNYEIPELKIESVLVPSVNVISSNKNILGIEAVTTTINGVTITINTDGTITLNGTSTDAIEFNLNGSSDNVDMLYLIKNNIGYAISGLTNNVSLSLYSNDGTDRTLVGTHYNGIVNLSETHVITQTTLNIASGVTFEKVVISPQIEIGEATGFVKHEETRSSGTLNDNECFIEGLMSYVDKTIIMIDAEVTSSIKYYTYQFLNEKFTEIEVNEKEIKSTVSEMNETIEGQNQRISVVTQKVDEINSKITDIADITTSAESEYASISLEKVNESEPIAIKVHPINEDISYLYPKNNLYPSNDLFLKNRRIRFTNDTTDEYIDYELPADLLYYDENTYDEFILNYDSQTCSVIKRVEYIDANGNKGIKTEEIINYDYPTIPLTAGDYTISLLGSDAGYIYAQLMASNIYTTQFATKVELDSSITQTRDSITSEVKATYATKNDLNTSVSTIKQTTDSINLEVSKKVNNSDYTSAQILLKINNDTSSTVIKSDKVDINAIATFTNNKLAQAGSTTINGSNITTGTISAQRLDSKVITTDNFSAQKINADNITTGTLSASKISGGSITSSSITLSNIFKAYSNGHFEVTNSTGYFVMGPKYGNVPNLIHPYASGLNIAYGSTGISFRSSSEITSTGSERGYIHLTSDSNRGATYQLNLQAKDGLEMAAEDGASIYMWHKIELGAKGGASVWVKGNDVSSYARVTTSSGDASSRILKENIKPFESKDYEDAYNLLKNIELSSYDYKYSLYKDKHQYGFIIDDIETLENNDKFFKFDTLYAKVDGESLDPSIMDEEGFNKDNLPENCIKYKEYNSDVLDKYMLTCLKALQNKIEVLERKINNE